MQCGIEYFQEKNVLEKRTMCNVGFEPDTLRLVMYNVGFEPDTLRLVIQSTCIPLLLRCISDASLIELYNITVA